jgi:hypothetical protein
LVNHWVGRYFIRCIFILSFISNIFAYIPRLAGVPYFFRASSSLIVNGYPLDQQHGS